MAKQDDWKRITLRIPPDLYDRIAEAAGASSVNAEIIARLEATLSPQPTKLTESDIARTTEFLKFITATMMSDREVKSALIESLLQERSKGDSSQ